MKTKNKNNEKINKTGVKSIYWIFECSSFFALDIKRKLRVLFFQDPLQFVWAWKLCNWILFVNQLFYRVFMRIWLGKPWRFRFVRDTSWTFQLVFFSWLSLSQSPKLIKKYLFWLLLLLLFLLDLLWRWKGLFLLLFGRVYFLWWLNLGLDFLWILLLYCLLFLRV